MKTSCLLRKQRRVFLSGFQLIISNLVPRVLSYPPYGAGRREPWERGCIISSFSAARARAYFLTSDFLPLLTFLTLELQSDFRLLTSDFRQQDREFNLVFHACPTLLVRILTGLQLYWFDDYACELRLVAFCFLRVACCVLRLSRSVALMPVECCMFLSTDV